MMMMMMNHGRPDNPPSTAASRGAAGAAGPAMCWLVDAHARVRRAAATAARRPTAHIKAFSTSRTKKDFIFSRSRAQQQREDDGTAAARAAHRQTTGAGSQLHPARCSVAAHQVPRARWRVPPARVVPRALADGTQLSRLRW